MLQPVGFGLARRKHADISRQRESAGNLAFCVVIAMEEEDWNIGMRQPAHLLHEEKSGLIIAPIAVIEVAGDYDEIDLVLDCLGNKIVERHARCGANPFGCRALLPGKPLQGAVEMDVASMNEAKCLQNNALPNRMLRRSPVQWWFRSTGLSLTR